MTVAAVAKQGKNEAALLAMIARRAEPWPSGDGEWAELSCRFVALGLGITRMQAWRLLDRVGQALGLVALPGAAAERAGVTLRARTTWRKGTVWRIAGKVIDEARSLLAKGTIAWHPPDTARTWWAVRGLDPNKAKGTCFCPHPDHQGVRPRCAYTRHTDGTWALTCQLCADGAGRPLTFFARQAGRVEASLTHRAMAADGRQGMDVDAELRIRSKRTLGIYVHPAEEREIELRRKKIDPSKPYPAAFKREAPGSPEGAGRCSLSQRDTPQVNDLLDPDPATGVPLNPEPDEPCDWDPFTLVGPDS